MNVIQIKNRGPMISRLPSDPLLKLNLGAGTVRKREGYLNIDKNPETKPDVVATLPLIPAGGRSCSHLYASHFLEHLTKDQVGVLMLEAARVLVPGGLFEIVVPYALHEDAHVDPTHKSYWTPGSFRYYTPAMAYLGYGGCASFEVVDSDLIDGKEVRALLRRLAD